MSDNYQHGDRVRYTRTNQTGWVLTVMSADIKHGRPHHVVRVKMDDGGVIITTAEKLEKV